MSKAAARPFHHSFLGTPYQGFEVLVAGCVALSVPVWSALLLSMSKLGEQAVAVEIRLGPEHEDGGPDQMHRHTQSSPRRAQLSPAVASISSTQSSLPVRS